MGLPIRIVNEEFPERTVTRVATADEAEKTCRLLQASTSGQYDYSAYTASLAFPVFTTKNDSCKYWRPGGGSDGPCGECRRCRDADGVPDFIHDMPTRRIVIGVADPVRPYPPEMYCTCGAVCADIDPKLLKTTTDGQRRIVRCPNCPKRETFTGRTIP